MSADGRHLFTGPGQLAEARRRLGLSDTAPAGVVEAEVRLRLGLADELVAEVDRTLQNEMAYLHFAWQFGWAWWSLDT